MTPNLQERPQYLYHFVLHAALDAVEEQEWHSNAMHLGVVDRFNNLQVCPAGECLQHDRCPAGSRKHSAMMHRWRRLFFSRGLQLPSACAVSSPPVSPFPGPQVSAFTTAAHVRFLLLHDGRSDDLVKSFFRDVYELYLRVGGVVPRGRARVGAGWSAYRFGCWLRAGTSAEQSTQASLGGWPHHARRKALVPTAALVPEPARSCR